MLTRIMTYHCDRFMEKRSVVQFGLSREMAQQRIRTAMEQGAFEFDPHCTAEMVLRDISMRQVLTAAKEGCINQGPELDEFGDWRCRIKKRVAGRLVRVVVAVQTEGILFVTAF